MLELDGAVGVAGATPAMIAQLSETEPHGSGCPAPRFAVPACRIDYADVVGADHVRCRLAGADGARLKGIAFRAAEHTLGRSLLGAVGRAVHVAGTLRADRWRGREDVQMVIEDLATLDAGGSR